MVEWPKLTEKYEKSIAMGVHNNLLLQTTISWCQIDMSLLGTLHKANALLDQSTYYTKVMIDDPSNSHPMSRQVRVVVNDS